MRVVLSLESLSVSRSRYKSIGLREALLQQGAMVDSVLRIREDDISPRVSVGRHRRSLALFISPLLIVDGLSRKGFFYRKLPTEPLKLSVLKLDGSCFGNLSLSLSLSSLSVVCFSNCFCLVAEKMFCLPRKLMCSLLF
jgi:hypothetical protein